MKKHSPARHAETVGLERHMDADSGPEESTTDVEEEDLRRALEGEGETSYLAVEETGKDIRFPGNTTRRTPRGRDPDDHHSE
ncbi:hypothetical protein ACFY7C_00020 [Streptomyces sp. NPDC012769]|uniref:hypothetical protein n=1 Tax=Streptomyces sp. NPDC012769 TaxID=3364848 RepID=UPI0036CD966D